jgi:hypothetical protein
MLQIVLPLTDDSTGIIDDCNRLIVQVTGACAGRITTLKLWIMGVVLPSVSTTGATYPPPLSLENTFESQLKSPIGSQSSWSKDISETNLKL